MCIYLTKLRGTQIKRIIGISWVLFSGINITATLKEVTCKASHMFHELSLDVVAQTLIYVMMDTQKHVGEILGNWVVLLHVAISSLHGVWIKLHASTVGIFFVHHNNWHSSSKSWWKTCKNTWATPPGEVGWQGEGPIASAVADARSQGAGRPREKGERPTLTLGRDSTMTTIGMMHVVK